MDNWEIVIGIEIHLELNTKTKMFSPSLNKYGASPNTNVHVIDLGYPGTMPRVNKQAVVKAIMLAKSLSMQIDQVVRFDRKNYFYFDLPKGYQITQNFHPIGKNGKIPIVTEGVSKNVQIERIHLEEDTAKAVHTNGQTFLDYNRAGVPLIEIVTKPVIRSAEEAASYVNAVRTLVKTLGISNAKMEQGSLRADVNISVRPFGQKNLNTKVEIKNINSVSNIKKAIDLEVKEQIQKMRSGQKVAQSTKRFDDKNGKNILIRSKQDALDYKYFAEPNITPVKLSDKFIEDVKIPELPWEKKRRYEKDQIPPNYIYLLTSKVSLAKYFDQIKCNDKGKWAKVFFAEILPLAANKEEDFGVPIRNSDVEKMLEALEKGSISSKQIKKIVPLLLKTSKSFEEVVKEQNFVQISDPTFIVKLVNEVIRENPSFVEQSKHNLEKVLKFVIGNVMKKSKGQVNPSLTSKLAKEILSEKEE